MAADPANEFAALIQTRLAGRPPTPEPDGQAVPPTPRLPSPNVAQGSSGLATPVMTPEDRFALIMDDLRASLSHTGHTGLPGVTDNAGWRQV